MAKKMGKGLVALSSAAILSVYGVGYAMTQPAAATMAAGLASSPDTSTSAGSSSGTSAATSAPSQAAAPASTNTLKDGTYSGSGMSRHGGVSVSVTVQNGRVVSAPITGVTTRYSESVIAGLPATVVTAQSSRINLVSGATDSSMAYQQAVSQALSQAQSGSAGQSTSAVNTTTGAANSGSQGYATGLTGAPGANVQVTGPNGTIYSNGTGRRHRTGVNDDR